jgi:hypothetical protein
VGGVPKTRKLVAVVGSCCDGALEALNQA